MTTGREGDIRAPKTHGHFENAVSVHDAPAVPVGAIFTAAEAQALKP